MIARDEQARFFAGTGVAATVALYVDPLAGLAAGVIAGAVKEGTDLTGRGTPDR